jgi:hypothetical protein
MFNLKMLSKESIPQALKKAERYRLLNEPHEAESICLDILEIKPDSQQALITLLLAHTDKFKASLYPAFDQAQKVLEQLGDGYCKHYYQGIINERRGKTHMINGGPGSGEMAHDWYVKAMDEYEQALQGCTPKNEGAALRWNACARILNENQHLRPAEERREMEVLDGYE